MILDYLLYVALPFIMRLVGMAAFILATWGFVLWLWYLDQGQAVSYVWAVKAALRQIGLTW